MQITERSHIGLRCARISLSAPGLPNFTLFPMVHIADQAFFEQVRNDAAIHDLVLREGVNAPLAKAVNLSLRLATRGATRLAHQSDHMSNDELGLSERADMEGEAFTDRWRTLPLWLRASFLALLPIVWLFLRFTGVRKWIIEGMEDYSDQSIPEEIMPGDGAIGQLRNLLLDERDARLAEYCDRAIDESGAQSIAVIYGSAHMPALVRHLKQKFGYRPEASEWMTAVAA